MPDEPTSPAGLVGRFTTRARRAARSLKDEYEAGKRGDTTPAAPIWATPTEQLDLAVRLVRAAGDKAAAGADEGAATDVPVAATEPPVAGGDAPAAPGADEGTEAGAVAGALRRVDWSAVRAATADRTSDAGRAARTLAAQVDWARVQPAAQRLSVALIGAVATGQVGIGGPLGPLVARAIVDQGGFGQRVEDRLETDHVALPADLADVIDTTGRPSPE